MRLLNLSLEEINQLIDGLERESKAIKAELFKMCWFMRGGMSVTESYLTDVTDREIIASMVADNIKTTKETQLPFF